MTFIFSQEQITELTNLRLDALAAIAADPNVQGAYAPVYTRIFEMISDNYDPNDLSSATPKEGVEAGAWVFLRGVPLVNAGIGNYSQFIRTYTATQYKYRFGEDIFNEEELDHLVQDVSDQIAENIIRDILNLNENNPNPSHQLPTVDNIADNDAEAAAEVLFGIEQIAGWAGNPFFLPLGHTTSYSENILHSNISGYTDTYDVLTVYSAIIEAGLDIGPIDTLSTLSETLFHVIPDGIEDVADAILTTVGLVNAVTQSNELVENLYGFDLIDLFFSTGNFEGGDDIYLGTFGNDTLNSGDPLDDDLIHAGDGDDTVFGTNGDDFLDGGNGIDWVDYSEFDGAIDNDVTVNIATGIASVNDTFTNFTDRIYNFENVKAGSGSDIITGNNVDNILIGGEGNDRLEAGIGTDSYIFSNGDGDDTISDVDGLGHIVIDVYQIIPVITCPVEHKFIVTIRTTNCDIIEFPDRHV